MLFHLDVLEVGEAQLDELVLSYAGPVDFALALCLLLGGNSVRVVPWVHNRLVIVFIMLWFVSVLKQVAEVHLLIKVDREEHQHFLILRQQLLLVAVAQVLLQAGMALAHEDIALRDGLLAGQREDEDAVVFLPLEVVELDLGSVLLEDGLAHVDEEDLAFLAIRGLHLEVLSLLGVDVELVGLLVEALGINRGAPPLHMAADISLLA